MAAYTLQELRSMISVGMGDYKTAKGDSKLITRDLGSCVGIAMRDPRTGVGGLLHIMLPEHTPDDAAQPSFNPAKYAGAGIEEMVCALVREGAKRERLVAKIAGAAHIIRSEEVPEELDLSSRNVEAVMRKLSELNIPVLACEVGAYHPRTLVFQPGSGEVVILTAGKINKVI